MAQVKQIVVEGEGESARAVGVRLADGRVYRGRAVVSNATRWDTFERLLADKDMPEAEQLFRCWTPPAALQPVSFRSHNAHLLRLTAHPESCRKSLLHNMIPVFRVYWNHEEAVRVLDVVMCSS